MIPELRTERLLMRGWRNDDFDAFAGFCADEETARYVGGAVDREEAWRRMAAMIGHWSLRGYGFWALQDLQGGGFAGYCGLWFPEGWPEPEIGWGLLRDFHGRGLALEAAERSRAYAYDTLGWTTAVSCVALENSASRKLAERLGAIVERTLENRGWTVALYRHPAPSELN